MENQFAFNRSSPNYAFKVKPLEATQGNIQSGPPPAFERQEAAVDEGSKLVAVNQGHCNNGTHMLEMGKIPKDETEQIGESQGMGRFDKGLRHETSNQDLELLNHRRNKHLKG